MPTDQRKSTFIKPKVMIISSLGPLPYIGGIENVIDTLLHSELVNSFDFSVFDTYRDPDIDRGPIEKMVFALGLFFKCFALIFKTKPVLIHIHFCSKTDFWKHSICLFAGRILRKKTIFHLHGGNFEYNYRNHNFFVKLLQRTIFRLPQKVVGLSKYWADFLSEISNPEKVIIINNPIDCSRLRMGGGETTKGGVYKILLLGRVGTQKGHYDVMEAVPKLLERGAKVEFLIAGPSEISGDIEKLKKISLEKNIQNNIKFLGPVTGQPKYDLLSSSDLMILPSHGENMPISILEGMAAGLPIVATNVGAIPEILNYGEIGKIIEPRDPEALVEAIIEIMQNQDLANSYSQAGMAKVKKKWDIKTIATQLESIYYDLIPSKSSAHHKML